MNRDHDHLRLLGLFHYVYAAMMACTTSFSVVYLGFVGTMLPMMASEMEAEVQRQRAAAEPSEPAAEEQPSGESQGAAAPPDSPTSPAPPGPPAARPAPVPVGAGPPEAFFSMIRSMMYAIGTFMLLFGFSLAAANIYAARCIALRKHRTVCLLVAGFNCLNAPLGLILGIFTFLVLLRPSVEDLFNVGQDEQTAIVDATLIE